MLTTFYGHRKKGIAKQLINYVEDESLTNGDGNRNEGIVLRFGIKCALTIE